MHISSAVRLKSLVGARPVTPGIYNGTSSRLDTPRRCSTHFRVETNDRAAFYQLFSSMVHCVREDQNLTPDSAGIVAPDRPLYRHSVSQSYEPYEEKIEVCYGEILFMYLQAWHACGSMERSALEESLLHVDDYLYQRRLDAKHVFEQIAHYRYGFNDSSPDVCGLDLPSLVAIEPTVDVRIEQFTLAFLEKQKEALKEVSELLRKFEDVRSLYRNSAAMREHQGTQFDALTQDRLKVLYVWHNISRDLRRKIKEIGHALRLHKGPTADSIEWPYMHYNSPPSSPQGKSESSGEPPGSSSPRETRHEFYRELSTCSSLSDREIQTTAAVYQQFVEKSLRRRGMRQVLQRVMEVVEPTLRRAKLALAKPPLQVDEVASRKRPRSQSVAAAMAPRKGNKRLRLITNCTDAGAAGTQPEHTGARRQEMLTDEQELNQYGVQNPEFKAMHLPSFQPAYLFLLRVPVDLVHQWMKLRVTQMRTMDESDKSPDPLTLKQLIQDSQDVLESAVRVKSLYQEHVQAVASLELQKKLLVWHMIDFENDLSQLYQLYLENVYNWIYHWKEATGEYGRGLVLALEREWKFAKRIAISVQDGEAQAAKKFCLIARMMLDSVGSYLDQLSALWNEYSTEEYVEGASEDEEADRLANNRYTIFELCRALRLHVHESRERALRALTFAKSLMTDLQISAAFVQNPKFTQDQFIQKLADTGHCLIEIEGMDNSPSCLLFVPGDVITDEPYVQLLLNTTVGRSPEESPQMAGKNGYLLLITLRSNKDIVRHAWFGEVKKITPDADCRISLGRLQVEDVQLAVVHASQLKGQRKEFQRLLGDYLMCVHEFCSCNRMIVDSIGEMRSRSLKIREKIALWVLEIEDQLWRCTETQEYDTQRYAHRDAVMQAYNFAFEYHRELVKLISNPRRSILAEGLRLFANQWMNFVLNRCGEGKGSSPRWANFGVQFLVLASDPKYSSYYTDEQFKALKDAVSNCLLHLVGNGEPSPPEHSYSWSCSEVDQVSAAPRKVHLFSSSTGEAEELAKRPRFQLVMTARWSPHTQIHDNSISNALTQLETEREEQLRSAKKIGRIVERDTVLPSSQITHKRAPFAWQRLDKRIGRGASGEVYTALNLDTNQIMAVKSIPASMFDRNHKALKTVVDEITNFEGIQHKHLVRYYGVEVHKEEILLFMEYCSEGTLADVCKEDLSEELVRYYTQTLLSAVHELHRRNIVHRDIKSANIFLTSDNVLKLGDFGSSTRLSTTVTCDNEITAFVGTYQYMAPEVMSSAPGGYGRAADIWSVGCVVLEMATGKAPFHQLGAHQIIYQVGMGMTPLIPDNLSSRCKDFLRKCLRSSAAERPSVEKLMEHPFVKVHEDVS